MWLSEKNDPMKLLAARVATLAICEYGSEVIEDRFLWPGKADTNERFRMMTRRSVSATKPLPIPLSS
jgi:hypothetical protein